MLQAVVLAKSDVIEPENIFLKKSLPLKSENLFNTYPSLEELEKTYIKKVLDDSNWDKKKVVNILKIAKTTLYNKIDTYNLEKK